VWASCYPLDESIRSPFCSSAPYLPLNLLPFPGPARSRLVQNGPTLFRFLSHSLPSPLYFSCRYLLFFPIFHLSFLPREALRHHMGVFLGPNHPHIPRYALSLGLPSGCPPASFGCGLQVFFFFPNSTSLFSPYLRGSPFALFQFTGVFILVFVLLLEWGTPPFFCFSPRSFFRPVFVVIVDCARPARVAKQAPLRFAVFCLESYLAPFSHFCPTPSCFRSRRAHLTLSPALFSPFCTLCCPPAPPLFRPVFYMVSPGGFAQALDTCIIFFLLFFSVSFY